MGIAAAEKRRLEIKGLHKRKRRARIPPMLLPCDECQEPTDVKDIDIEPYVQVKTLASHLGIVREWYICKDCAKEKEWWRTQYGLDADGNPGI